MKLKWKDLIALAFILLCILGFTQVVAQDITLEGQLLNVRQADGAYQFTVRKDSGAENVVWTDGQTVLESQIKEIASESLLHAELVQPEVRVEITRRPRWVRLDGTFTKTYVADLVSLTSVLEEDAHQLPDGTMLDLRHYADRAVYQAKDGYPVFVEGNPTGPDNAEAKNLPTLADLNETAQDAIRLWYEDQGLLYDLDAELQSAYAAYTAWTGKKSFPNHYVLQQIFPNACNDELIWFATGLAHRLNALGATESRYCDAFRRDTGAHVALEELFTCPANEIGSRLLDAAKVKKGNVEEMKQVFRLENVVFHSEGVDIWFPVGSLTDSPDKVRIVPVEFDDVTDLLQPWAVPQKAK